MWVLLTARNRFSAGLDSEGVDDVRFTNCTSHGVETSFKACSGISVAGIGSWTLLYRL